MEQLRELLQGLPGKIGLYYKDITSGQEFCYNEDIQFIAASVIKLPLMMDIYKRAENGELSLGDLLATDDFMKFPGCGAIKSIGENISVSIQSLINLMITISDNTATNTLIRHVGIEKLKRGFAEMGLIRTQLSRELYDLELASKGVQNYFTPKEIGGLLESLFHGTFISHELSKEMIKILKAQQICHKIPDSLPADIEIANKTGESSGITHDVGIVYGERPFIFVFASMEGDASKSNDALRRAARVCYDWSNGV